MDRQATDRGFRQSSPDVRPVGSVVGRSPDVVASVTTKHDIEGCVAVRIDDDPSTEPARGQLIRATGSDHLPVGRGTGSCAGFVDLAIVEVYKTGTGTSASHRSL